MNDLNYCHQMIGKQKEREMQQNAKPKIYFYLFGGEACKLFEEGKSANYINKNADWYITTYQPLYNTPSELLAESQGWDEFEEISKPQYLKFLKLLPRD